LREMPISHIVSTGRAVPERVLTNFDLEKMVDTSRFCGIVARTGIRERYISENGIDASYLA